MQFQACLKDTLDSYILKIPNAKNIRKGNCMSTFKYSSKKTIIMLNKNSKFGKFATAKTVGKAQLKNLKGEIGEE